MTPPAVQELWVYLATSPLFWLGLTLAAYLGADAIAAATGRHPLANPVLMAVGTVCIVLFATGTTYPTYFSGAQFVHVLLGPATVALAVPIIRNRAAIRRDLRALVGALAVGSATGVASAIGMAVLFGGSEVLVRSVAPKSVTAAIAMGVSREAGGLPELTAVVVIATGITGAVLVTPLMNVLGIRDWRARGFGVGLAAHGIGTARALQVHPLAGTFAALAMALNGVMTAFLTPVLLRVMGG
jgi:predicted murein hydrolase (TIGR00659 family)